MVENVVTVVGRTVGIKQLLAILLFMLLNLADVITTDIDLSMGLTEGNPVSAWAYYHLGRAGMYSLKWISIFTIIGIVIYDAQRTKLRWAIPILNVIFALVVLNNLIQMILYR